MSMVGYILGLGDRHPCNLMIEKNSGKIIHIDFGDCFEVAMSRDRYPEKIPFRLTRMMINAMGVTGLEGTFRQSCHSVLRLLRNNKDSLMAVLEAFVYDPLINWRLLTKPQQQHDANTVLQNKFDGPSEQNSALNSVTSDASYRSVVKSFNSGQSDALSFHMRDEQISTERRGSQRIPVPASYYGASARGSIRQPSVQQNPLKQARMNDIEPGSELESRMKPEALNEKAVAVTVRIVNKLTGRDFERNEVLEVPQQVQRLIEEATSSEYLCQLYVGWCPFW